LLKIFRGCVQLALAIFGNKKELIADNNGFRPIDLNETNVEVIFKRCLLNENNRHRQVSTRSFLFLKELGYDVSKDKIYFDKNTIIANRKNIEYLFGQLQSIHNLKKPPYH
ncbi:MAG: hypothetical protein LUF81_08065, partial [Clostridiales bacterium]|nr:hypothetical protein [Clostridiales bacterium]